MNPWPYIRLHEERKVHIMRTSRFFSIVSCGAALAGGMFLLTPALSQTAKPEISYQRTDLNINQVLAKLMAIGYGSVDSIERERNTYEVMAIDKNGARVKLYVDPQTGDLLKTGRVERNRGRHAGDLASAG